MKRICDICGCEADEHWMMTYNIGRRTMWLCWDCFKKSQYEVIKSGHYRQQKLMKLHNNRKRNK